MKLLMVALVTLLLAPKAFSIPAETMARLKKLYPEQSEAFIQARLKAAKTPFDQWRAFPPYYYDLLKRSEKSLGVPFYERKGLCAGDSHFENFGFLFQSKAIFSVNDLDDVAFCALNVDALRLYLSHLFVSPVSAVDWLKAYQSGIGGITPKMPGFIQELENESNADGTKLPKKIKKLLTEGCSGEFSAVDKTEEQLLKNYFKTEGKELTFSCSRLKESGGSAGLKRYILFYDQNQTTAAIELKPLVNPAPQWDTVIAPPLRKKLFENAVAVYLTPAFQKEYFPVVFNNATYQRRPLLSGNAGVKLDDVPAGEVNQVMLFEAQILGLKHRTTNPEMLQIKADEWESWGKTIQQLWLSEFKK